MGHDKLYGICQNKCMVEITSKAEQETKDSSQDSKITTLEGDVAALETTVAGKQDTITAGTGLSKSGATLNHSNSVTAKTSYVGSATAVPLIKYDAQGHITATSTATIYPPTSVGTAGQYWESDGSGAGVWVTKDTAPTSGSTKAVTSGAVYTALSGKAASSHTHDDRYYTETEMDTKLSAKADASALSAKQDTVTGGASTITGSNLTASRALISNTDGKVAVSAVTSTELGYLDGVTSAIQTQLNGKAASSHTHDDRYFTESEVTTKLGTKQDTMSAGTGIALDGATINHSNSITAATTAKGSATAVPCIKYDAQGHITACSTATIYPPTSAGTSGQYWKSDGSGVGVWQTLDTAPTANSTNAVTSGAVKTALDAKAGTSVATTEANGLMSASDKSKLDAITASADSVSFSRSLSSGTKIGTITINGTGTDLYCQTNTDTNTTYSAGTGMSLSGTTFNHSNSVTAKTSYVGSATAVPMIKYDAQGHITAMTTATIYPPTSAGASGQIWVSDGSGAGAWKHKITMSTSDPSGGSDGDIWFKYE